MGGGEGMPTRAICSISGVCPARRVRPKNQASHASATVEIARRANAASSPSSGSTTDASGLRGSRRVDMVGEALQRSEDRRIVGIVGLQLDAIALLHDECDLEHVERIEPKPGAEQRRRELDRGRVDILEPE